MIVPEKEKRVSELLRHAVEKKLPKGVICDIVERHLPNVIDTDVAEGFTRAFISYEISNSRIPKGNSQTRKRSLQKIESSAKRLLGALDELQPDVFGKLEFELFEQEALRRIARNPLGQMELEMGKELSDRLFVTLSTLLRASRNQLKIEKNPVKNAYLRDTPLNRLVQDCWRLWSIHSSSVGIFYDSGAGSYSGPLFDLILEMFGQYFDPSVYQSEYALGKRIHRAVYAMRGTDIG